MFLIVDILNEGKVINNNAKPIFSEGKSPKSYFIDNKLFGCKSTKSQGCTNLNWQKLRR
jgi:hypothetical protein